MPSRPVQALLALLRLLRLPPRFLGLFVRRWRLLLFKLRQGVSYLLGSKPSHDYTSTTSHDSDAAIQFSTSTNDASTPSGVVICASQIPSRLYRNSPIRRGSLSQPNLRDTLTPIVTRPSSVFLPSHRTSTPPPDEQGHPSINIPHPATNTQPQHEDDGEYLARARAEYIANDARSMRRVGRSRVPTRQNMASAGASVRSRSPSVTPRPRSRSSVHLRPGSSAVSLNTEFAPGINLQPPSPEIDRRSRRTNSTDVGFNVQSPSTPSVSSVIIPSPVLSTRSRPPSPAPSATSIFPSDSDTINSDGFLSSCHSSVFFPEVPPHRQIKPFIPIEISRWTVDHFITGDESQFMITRMRTSFEHVPATDLRGWRPCMHTEGSLYFYHPVKRMYTEEYIYDPVILEDVEDFVQYLEKLVRDMTAIGSPMPSDDYELVLQIERDGEDISWQYYYVDHKTRALFWLTDIAAGEEGWVKEVLAGPMNPTHFQLALEAWYWDHVSLFPDSFELKVPLIEEMVGMLAYFSVDRMTAPYSNVPYNEIELGRMIKYFDRKNPGAGSLPYISAFGRIKALFCHWRYINFHAQRSPRLDRTQSLLQPPPKNRAQSWLMTFFSLAFFFAPDTHVREINSVYVDSVIVTATWKRYIEKLQSEWQEFILYATVMLNGNVAFLSIPDVIIFPDNDNSPAQGSNVQSYLKPLRSPAAIASYASVLFSIGSIVIGLILTRHNRTRHRENALEATNYMEDISSSTFGYAPIAIIYSLPYALLMWAVISFLAAILTFTFKDTEIVTRTTVSVVSAVIFCLICWCLLQILEKRVNVHQSARSFIKFILKGKRVPKASRELLKKKTKMWREQSRYARDARTIWRV